MVRGKDPDCEREHATRELGPLFHAAFAERIAHAEALKELALEMLGKIYLEELAYDIDYYSYWDGKDPIMTLKTCLENGLFADEAAALVACEGNLDNLDQLDLVRALGRRLNREIWLEQHHNQWHRFNEEETMYQGCSD